MSGPATVAAPASARELLRSSARTFLEVLVVAGAAFAIAAALRFGLVERDDLGAFCGAAQAPPWCSLRMLVIRGFLSNAYSMTSLVLATLAVWRASHWLARGAVAVGVIGMVLYDPWSGVGLVGGVLAMSRVAGQRQQDTQAQRHG